MVDNPLTEQQTLNSIYQIAADLMVNQKKTNEEVIQDLKNRGLNEEMANTVVTELRQQVLAVKKQRAQKDMLYGGLWCVGGTVATLSDIGFIFWGAIVFGGIQFIRGLINYL